MTRGRRISATTITEMAKLRDHDMYTPSVPPRTVAKAVTKRIGSGALITESSTTRIAKRSARRSAIAVWSSTGPKAYAMAVSGMIRRYTGLPKTTSRFGDQKPRLTTKARASAALRTPEIERDVLTSAVGSSDSGRNRTRAIGIPSDPIPTRKVTEFTIVAA